MRARGQPLVLEISANLICDGSSLPPAPIALIKGIFFFLRAQMKAIFGSSSSMASMAKSNGVASSASISSALRKKRNWASS